ncbi:MAG: GNAT family N-acetyltransferase [Cyanobacteria bacterium J069]
MLTFGTQQLNTQTSPISFRNAIADDSMTIARLFQIASDGVVDYIWQTQQPQYPGLTPLQIGATRYADPDNVFGYKNCVIAEQNREIVGMMTSFPIAPTAAESDTSLESSLAVAAELSGDPDVLAPYNLEAPGTWYICALAVFPEFRGRGIGSQLLKLAHQQAAEKGFQELSLLCFEQNAGALRLYQRNGFQERDRTAVVPHPLIHFTGDLLLLTTPTLTSCAPASQSDNP